MVGLVFELVLVRFDLEVSSINKMRMVLDSIRSE